MKYDTNDLKKTMTVKEFCLEYGFGENIAYELVNSSSFPKIRCGRKIVILRSKVDSWLEQQIGQTFMIHAKTK